MNSHFAKNSMNRFGDDLYEVIVDYLPLKDRVIFTSVNRQFKRCLFQKQFKLIIDSNHKNANEFNSIKGLIEGRYDSSCDSDDDSDHQNDDPNDDQNDDQNYDQNDDQVLNIVNKTAFEWIVKKCKRIYGLDFTNCLFEREVIELICNYCQHLKELYFMDNGFDEKDISWLGEICGAGLTKLVIKPLSFESKTSIAGLLSLTPNLTHLEHFNAFVDCNQALLPKFMSLKVSLNDMNCDHFQVFVNKFKEKIKSLKIIVIFKDGIVLLNTLLEITNCIHLNELSLIFAKDPKTNVRPIDDLLLQIATNCPKLSELEVCLAFCSYGFISGNLFAMFGLFHNLKVLKTCFPDNQIKTEHNFNYHLNEATVKCLQNCRNLTELTLIYSELSHNWIEGIHNYFPNLKKVFLETEKQLDDKFMNSISKLDNLKLFRLNKSPKIINQTFYGITDVGLKSLLDSKKIETIIFRGRPQITDNSIEYLIERAVNNHKRKFELSIEYKHIHDCERIDMKRFHELPTNLQISISGPFDNLLEELTDSEDHSIEEDSDDYDSMDEFDYIISNLMFL